MNTKANHSILAVDDSPENLDLIKCILEPYYNLKVTRQGELALHIAATQQPDIILPNIVLNDMDGYEICGSDYITKPFSPQIVLARVKTHIELKTKTDLLERRASMDGLTEVSNRRALDAAIARQ